MTTISSSSLFHFVGNKQYLENILRFDFRPRYYPEIIKFSNRTVFQKAIPVVCFCDLPLSQIKDHLKIYGDYGIGLTKEWGIKNELNPINYISEKSPVSKAFRTTVQALNSGTLTPTNANAQQKDTLALLRYMKNYKGDFIRQNRRFNNVHFYDEREWRFTQQVSVGVPFWLDMDSYNDPVTLNGYNDALSHQPLRFVPSDIKYIILKDDAEIIPMVQLLNNVKGRNYSYNDVVELTTRIITIEQIKKDF